MDRDENSDPFRLRLLQHNMRRARDVTDKVRSLIRSKGIDVLLAQEFYCAWGRAPGLGVASKVVTGTIPVMAPIAIKAQGCPLSKSRNCATQIFFVLA